MLSLVISLLIISFIYGSFFTKNRYSKVLSENIVVEPTLTPTIVPTNIPTNKTILQPTKNPYFTNRIKEIDTKIIELQARKNKIIEISESSISQIEADLQNRPKGLDPSYAFSAMISIKVDANNKLQIINEEINTLNAEKTQIMLGI